MSTFLRSSLALILWASGLSAAGSVSQSCTPIGLSGFWVVAFNWTGDSITGSVPVTPVSGCPQLQGYVFAALESAPGTPAPTNGYSLKVLDSSGTDILGGSGTASSTAPQLWTIITSAPPVNGTFSLSITGNSVASAHGSVNVYLSVIPPVPTSSSGSGITSLTGDGTASGPGAAALILATVNSGPGACGDSTHVCAITTNAKGLVTAQSAVAISGSGGSVTWKAVGSTVIAGSTFNIIPLDGATITTANNPAGTFELQIGPDFTKVPFKVNSGTATLGTSAIASTACATVVTVAAIGTLTTDVVNWSLNGDISAITGYAPATTGGLAVYVYPSANAINVKVCNPTSSSITPGSAITLNWMSQR